jgi:hypothetical protein
MAKKKIELDLDIHGNVEATVANLKKLKAQLKDTAAGSEEFKKLYNEIDDLEDKIKGARKGSADWIDTLEAAGGPLGMLGGALNKAKVATISFSTALKASGIGLVVATVGLLVTAFTKTEGSMKKLEPLMIQLEKILGGLVEAFTPLIEGFAEMAMVVLPYLVKGITAYYGSLVALFTLIKEAGSGIGNILTGILTGDRKRISEGYDQLVNSWDKTIDRYNQFQTDYDKGSKKLTATEKKNLEERNKNQEEADKKAEEQRKAQEEIIFRAELAKANEFDKRRLEARKKLLEDEKAANKNNKALLAARQIYAIEIEKIDRDQISARRTMVLEFQNFETKVIQDSIASQQEKIRLTDLQLQQEGGIRREFNKKLNESELYSLGIRRLNFELFQKTDDKLAVDRLREDLKGRKIADSEKEVIIKNFTKRRKELYDLELKTIETLEDNYKKKALTDRNIFDEQVIKQTTEAFDKEYAAKEKYYSEEIQLLDIEYFNKKKEKDKDYYDTKRTLLNLELDEIKNVYLDEQIALQELYFEGFLTEKEYREKSIQLEKDYTIKVNKLTQERVDTSRAEKDAKVADLLAISAALGTLATAFAENTAAYKIAALAQIAIDTGVAISRVIAVISAGPAASNPFTYVAAIATQIAAITVNVAKAIRLVEGASVPTPSAPGVNVSNTNFAPTPINVIANRAEGGFVYGKGNSRSDSIPAMLSNGEFVVNAESSAMFAPLLSTINSIGNQPQFRMSGLNTNSGNSLNSGLESLAQTLTGGMSSRPIQTYVVSEQMTNQQQFDRTIKSRSLV